MPDEFNYIERIAGLIIKYHREEINESEYQELMDWRHQSAENWALFDKLAHADYVRDIGRSGPVDASRVVARTEERLYRLAGEYRSRIVGEQRPDSFIAPFLRQKVVRLAQPRRPAPGIVGIAGDEVHEPPAR